MRIASNPKHPNNDWYEELCALAAIGEMSGAEFDELQLHLAECGDCRELYADFRRMTADDLGAVAVRDSIDKLSEDDGSVLDESDLLKRFLERAKREHATIPVARPGEAVKQPMRDSVNRLVHWLRRPALSYATVGLLLCAVAAMAAYRLKEAQISPTLADLQSKVMDWRGRAQTATTKEESAAQQLKQSEADRATLQKSLLEAQARYSQLQAQQNILQSELATARTQVEQQGQELQAANAGTAETNRQLRELQARMQNAVQRTEEQRRIAENLQAKLEWTQQMAKTTTPEAQGFSDVEAKDLFGARDLHIVDVYDVTDNGKTRRSYGRVYYAEKKLLIFYAFDLQDKKHKHGAAAFQAWGYRQPNEEQPENLGLFSIDDASVNRWVLKINNPRVLEHIDAVFVTAEGPKGSPSPRGQRLMYANLASPPNHP